MRYEDREFHRQDLVLDGNVFVRCAIVECTLHYSGRTDIELDECLMRDNQFRYRDEAANTIRALQAIVRAGPTGLDHVMKLVVTGASVDWQKLAELAPRPE